MPGGFPIGLELCNATSVNSSISAFSNGATAGPTPSATANTKGSWTQLIAATTFDAIQVRVDMYLQTVFAAAESIAIDIGIGASGSEYVLIPNLMFSTPGQFQSMKCQYNFPLQIKAGQRIAVRSQSNLASNTDKVSCVLTLLNGGFTTPAGYAGVDAIGFNASAPTATVTTPVASPGVVNWTSHGFVAGQQVAFSGGTLPTGITANTFYYIIPTGLTTNAFEISATYGGTAINFTGTSSGTQTGVGYGTLGSAILAGNASKSAYTQLTPGTLKDYVGFALAVDAQGNASGNNLVMVDIAIGAAGSEVVILPNQMFFVGAQGFTSDLVGINIPMGTRIAARAASVSNATQILGVTLYGLF